MNDFPDSQISPAFRSTVQITSPATLFDQLHARTVMAALSERPAPRGVVHDVTDWRDFPEQTPEQKLVAIKANLGVVKKLISAEKYDAANEKFNEIKSAIRGMLNDEVVRRTHPLTFQSLGDLVAPKYMAADGFVMLLADIHSYGTAHVHEDGALPPVEKIAAKVQENLTLAAKRMNGLGYAIGITREERLQSAAEPFTQALQLINMQIKLKTSQYADTLLQGVVGTQDERTFKGSKVHLWLAKLAAKYPDGVIPDYKSVSDPRPLPTQDL